MPPAARRALGLGMNSFTDGDGDGDGEGDDGDDSPVIPHGATVALRHVVRLILCPRPGRHHQ